MQSLSQWRPVPVVTRLPAEQAFRLAHIDRAGGATHRITDMLLVIVMFDIPRIVAASSTLKVDMTLLRKTTSGGMNTRRRNGSQVDDSVLIPHDAF